MLPMAWCTILHHYRPPYSSQKMWFHNTRDRLLNPALLYPEYTPVQT